MRLIVFTLCVMFGFSLNAQIVSIPDSNFKTALLNHDPVIDTNGDGEIQESEATSFTGPLLVGQSDIADLTGVQSFTSISTLICSGNNLTTLDVSLMNNLGSLSIEANMISSISLPLNSNISVFNFSANDFTSIDVSMLSNLVACYGSNNALSTLDVSQNPDLVILALPSNNIPSIDVTSNTNLIELDINDNLLTSLDVTQNLNLEQLRIYNNPIQDLDLTQNPDLNTLSFWNTDITELNLSQNPELIGVFGYDNNLETFNIRNGGNENTIAFDLTNNPSLFCITVDDEQMANNGEGSYSGWLKDSQAIYSEDCSLSMNDDIKVSLISYPNPVEDVLYFFGVEESFRVQLFSANGRILVDQWCHGKNNSVSMAAYSPGVYYLQITANSKKKIQKIIKK